MHHSFWAGQRREKPQAKLVLVHRYGKRLITIYLTYSATSSQTLRKTSCLISFFFRNSQSMCMTNDLQHEFFLAGTEHYGFPFVLLSSIFVKTRKLGGHPTESAEQDRKSSREPRPEASCCQCQLPTPRNGTKKKKTIRLRVSARNPVRARAVRRPQLPVPGLATRW